MKIVAISDTHTKHRLIDRDDIPIDTDILLHAGDITWNGEYSVLDDFNEWLGHLSWIEHKIVIAGNHDLSLQSNPTLAESYLTNATYLRDSSINIDGIEIYGSPWCPRFGAWAFYDDRGEDMAKHWVKMVEGYKPDILMTHGPAYGTLDLVPGGIHAGCEELAKAIAIAKPKLHVCGHIHEGYGQVQVGDTLHVNASTVNRSYMVVHKPQIIEIDF